ncbi:MAG: hypothetical protein JSS14_16465 [Proteobacteria bacterium]|nr:hypothetical protein [Pseudomonadota bacterium]
MARPPEYENLIKTKAFEEVRPTPGAIAGHLQNARDYLAAAAQLDAKMPMQAFTMAYEGFFQVVQAVLEFHQVRTKEAGRNLAIQRVCVDLQLSAPEFQIVSRAHARRNATSYQSPFPPVSRAEADALAAILAKAIPAAERIASA